MAIEVLVAGVNRSAKRPAESSLTWEDQVNGRGSLTVTFHDAVGGWRPEDGQELLVIRDDPAGVLTADGAQVLTSDNAPLESGPERLFGGILTEPSEFEELGAEEIFFECEAVEFSSVCDRRLVTRIYEGQNVDVIVRDIVTRDLAGEGINTGGVVTGPRIEKAVFADVTVTEAFNQLAELVGYSWRIDQYRVLQFRPWAGLLAPIALDGDTLLAGTVRVRRDRQKYRNQQIVRAGTDLTDPRSETLVGDGQRRVFATAFPLGSEPVVEESRAGGAFVPKTVGILGVEQGFDWYWNSGQAQISQDDDATLLAAPTNPSAPATGDRLRVTYRGLFPVKTQYLNLGEIDARRAVEGGSGVYAAVEDRPEINSVQSAIDLAVALIERYGEIGTVLEGRTLAATLEPGQVATVNLPRHGLVNEEMLIESVSAEYDAETDLVWHTLRALSGDAWGGWQEYFRRLLKSNRATVIGREGEVLVLLRAAAAQVSCDATASVATVGPESRIGIGAIGTMEIGAAP